MITRWGTQFELISRLIQSKNAIKANAVDPRAEMDPWKLADMTDNAFWFELGYSTPSTRIGKSFGVYVFPRRPRHSWRLELETK